jgi:hypothetical protein
MPTVKDETGEVVAELSYNEKGKEQAKKMVQENPGYTVVDAMKRSQTMYMGGGMVKKPMYKKGGKVKK